MIQPILILACLAALIAGTITDLKKREVPDWINYGLIFAGIGLNLILSIVLKDWSYIIFSLVGFGVFFLVAALMFYTAQWGGGDSKMLMGIGAVVGLPLKWPLSETISYWSTDPFHNLPFIFYFILFTMFIGSIYGIIWSVVLSVKNYKRFKEDFVGRMKQKSVNIVRWAVLFFVLVICVIVIFSKDTAIKIGLASIGIIVAISFYLFIYIKSVEKVCMQKYVLPMQLTEGDWIVDNIKIGGKVIAGPKDLGISKEQILELIKYHKQGKIKKVLIKEGIPFVPSFLMGFLAALVYLRFF